MTFLCLGLYHASCGGFELCDPLLYLRYFSELQLEILFLAVAKLVNTT